MLPPNPQDVVVKYPVPLIACRLGMLPHPISGGDSTEPKVREWKQQQVLLS
jgi:hypothetical protein